MKIDINKTTSDQEHPYCIVNVAANQEALSTLSKSAYCLYMYFMQYQNKYSFNLRRTHAMNITNMSKSAYHRALEELIMHGYIVRSDEGYGFFECPDDIDDL